MVCSVGSVEELYSPVTGNIVSERILQLESMFIERRNLAEKMVIPGYYRILTNESLEDQMLTINGFSIETAHLDSEYRGLTHSNFSDPNYEQFQIMLRGAKAEVLRERKYRQNMAA